VPSEKHQNPSTLLVLLPMLCGTASPHGRYQFRKLSGKGGKYFLTNSKVRPATEGEVEAGEGPARLLLVPEREAAVAKRDELLAIASGMKDQLRVAKHRDYARRTIEHLASPLCIHPVHVVSGARRRLLARQQARGADADPTTHPPSNTPSTSLLATLVVDLLSSLFSIF
jgi:hypothetical protein